MSKYIKLEDASKVLENTIRIMQGFEENLETSLADLPTIEVSEDCISREWLRNMFGLSEKTRKWGGDHSGYNTMMLYEIQNYIEDAPSVVPSRAEGEWIEHKLAEEYDGLLKPNYECSQCHDWLREQTNYCPNCGAKMRSE